MPEQSALASETQNLNKILTYLYENLKRDNFINFITENSEYFDDLEDLLSLTYKEEYLDFESFVQLAIKILKPAFDGKVYVKYNRYYSTHDEDDRIIGILGQEVSQIHLSQVPEFVTSCEGDSLGVNLENEQEVEIVLAILSIGEYELPESDIEEGNVEISIKEPEIINDNEVFDEDELSDDFIPSLSAETVQKGICSEELDEDF